MIAARLSADCRKFLVDLSDSGHGLDPNQDGLE
jgi:hypothetical protein